MHCLALVASAGLACAAEKSLPPAATKQILFSRDIKPILEQSCVNCHGKGRVKGGLQLDSRETLLAGGNSGPAVQIGKSGESLLIDLVAGVNPDNIMPQKGKRLTEDQVGLLRAWIDQGLAWDNSVSFARKAPLNLTPRKVMVTPPAGMSPIDHILAHYFATNSATRAAVRSGGARKWRTVNDRLFARRVFLDLTGLLPSAQDIEDFKDDPRPDKRERLVKHLLGREQAYADHWLSFWNDLLRNDYRGTGYIDGGRQQITAWLYAALSTNKPYDQFVAELVNPTPESAGFAKGIVWRGVVNASQTPEMQAAQNVSQVFMGVNIKCASCHDSFINDWRLSDAYGLAAIYSDGPLEMFLCDKPTGNRAQAQFIYPELGSIDPAAPKPERLKRLAEIVTGPADGRLSRTIVNRLWARFFGYGLVEPVDDMEQPAWCTDLLDWLAEDLAENGYDLKRTMSLMLSSRAYQLPAVDLGEVSDKHYVFRGPGVRRLSAEQFRDAVGQLTGVWHGKAAFGGRTNEVRAALVAADPLAVALGRPNREQVITTRASTATTLQALELTNGETATRLFEEGAANLLEHNASSRALISQVYQTAFARTPTARERKVSLALTGDPVTAEGLQDLLWAVAMLPEFQLIH